MINWHGQQCLEYIRPQWLSEVAISLNPKRKLHPRAQPVALHAITRIDVSNSVLTELPLIIFQLQSVRRLNLNDFLPASSTALCWKSCSSKITGTKQSDSIHSSGITCMRF